MKNTFLPLIVAFSMLFTGGCDHLRPKRAQDLPDTANPSKILVPVKKGLVDVSQDLENTEKSLGEAADAVRRGADGAEAGAEAGDVQKVRQEAQNLRNTADSIDKDALDLVRARTEVKYLIEQLNTANLQTDDLVELYNTCRQELKRVDSDAEAQAEAYEKQIADLTAERDKALNKMLLFIIGGSLLVTAFSIAMVVRGDPKMMGLAVAGVVSMGLAHALRSHSKVFSVGVTISVVICVILIIYKVVRHMKAEKALEETVYSVEAMKQNLDAEARAKIFGDGAIPGSIDGIQSKSTKDLVMEKRQAIKKRIEPVIGR